MGKEIERKFLVVDQSYLDRAACSREIAQGYISTNPDTTVRVRIAGDHGYLTFKSRNHGVERGEWEYEIPLADARELLADMCGGKTISKTRYYVLHGGHTWEVDVFHGRLEGLVVAEVELPSADSEIHPLPSFIGREVSGDIRYYNSMLFDAAEPPV